MILGFDVFLATGADLSRLVQIPVICAYIDPGTGSLVLQVVLGSALACLVVIKLHWRQLKGFVGGMFHRPPDGPEAQSPEDDESGTDRQEGSGDV